MATSDPGLSLAPALGRALPHSAEEAQTVPACVIRIVADRSAAVVPRDATSTAGGAHAHAPVPALQFGAGLLVPGDAHRATSVAVTAGGVQIPGATLFAPAAPARDPCLVPALAHVPLIHHTRAIAAAGAALGRVAGAERA